METWTTRWCKSACLLAQEGSCMEGNTSSDTCMPWDNRALFSSWLHAVMMLPKSVSQFDKGIWVQERDWLSSPKWDDVHVPAVMMMSLGICIVSSKTATANHHRSVYSQRQIWAVILHFSSNLTLLSVALFTCDYQGMMMMIDFKIEEDFNDMLICSVCNV